MPRTSAYANLCLLSATAESRARPDSEEQRCELRRGHGPAAARAGADSLCFAPLHLLT